MPLPSDTVAGPTAPLRVAFVEDDAGLRADFAAIFRRASELTCVGLYASAEAALDALPQLQPDVVLADIRLPGQSGVQLVAALKPCCPRTRFLMFTVADDDDTLFEALRAGASGYLLKGTPPAQVLAALQEVAAGGAPMSRTIARRLVQHFQALPRPVDELARLTAREREILQHLATGCTYKEIAHRLGLSVETVRNHLRHVYDKLHVHSGIQAVTKWLRR